jgi:hypothetical protein
VVIIALLLGIAPRVRRERPVGFDDGAARRG